MLCRLIPESGLIETVSLPWMATQGFTPVQYRLTELFLVYAKQVYVTVTADEAAGIYGKMGIQNLFLHEPSDGSPPVGDCGKRIR